MALFFLRLIVVSCVCVHWINAQITCETWEGSPTECSAFLSGRSVAVFGNLTQNDTVLSIAALVQQASAAQLLAPLCYEHAMSLLCRSAFPRCVNATLSQSGTQVSAFQPQCRSNCLDTNTVCAQVFAAVGASPVNCTAESSTIPEVMQFPDGNITLCLNGELLNIPCEQGESPLQCPVTRFGPLIPVPIEARNRTYGLPCWRCPPPVFISDAQYSIAWRVPCVIAGTVTYGHVLVIIPTIFLQSRHTFPGITPVYLVLAYLLTAISYLIPPLRGYKHTYCEHDWEMASSSHVVCTVQAFFFYYGNLTMEAWITCILFNVWSMVYRKAEPRPHWHYVELCLCWGAPLIGAIILLVTKQFEYDGLAACQIGNRWPVGSNDTLSVPWFSITLWYGPNVIMLIVSTALMSMTMWRVIDLNRRNNGTLASILRHQWRTLTYYLAFMSLALWFLALFGQQQATKHNLNKATAEWVQCTFLSLDPTKCVPSLSPPITASIGLLCVDALVGIWMCIVFGSLPECLAFWRRLWSALSSGEWSRIAATSSYVTTEHERPSLPRIRL